MFFAMIALFATAIGVLFTSCSQYPGTNALVNTSFPLTDGFSRIFHLSVDQARWISFPALFANFFGFIWACGRQLSSMAKSGLLPEICGYMTKATDTPYIALIVGMILCLSLSLVSHYQLINKHFKEDVKHMYMLSSYVIAMSLFCSYIVFKQKYSSLPRSFTSPVGIYGALLGMFIFACNGIAILIDQGIFQIPLGVLGVATVLMCVYYFIVLDGNQKFSEEEKEKLFKAYLINGKSLSLSLSLYCYGLIINNSFVIYSKSEGKSSAEEAFANSQEQATGGNGEFSSSQSESQSRKL